MVTFTTWNNRSIRTKGLLLVAIPTIPMILSLGAAHFFRGADQSLHARLDELRRTRAAADAVLEAAVDAETGVRGYAISEDGHFLEPYRHARRALPQALVDLADASHADGVTDAAPIAHAAERQLRAVEALRTVERAENHGGEVADDPDSGAQERWEMAVLLRQKATTDELRAAVGRVGTALDREILAASAATHRAQEATNWSMTSGVVGGVAAGVIAAWLAMTGIAGRMRALQANARRVGDGVAVRSLGGLDEVAAVNEALEQASNTLLERDQEREHAQAALATAKEEAERANRAKSQFLSRMSHEFRTPLNAVLGFAQLLNLDMNTDQERESLEHIVLGGQHLLSLVDEVLDIARIESGEMTSVIAPVDIAQAVSGSLKLIAPLAAERCITTSWTITEEGLHVAADRHRLDQVLLNLLSNAVKYNRDGGHIHVSVTSNHGRVELAVSDTGIGLPEHKLDELFTPFERLGREANDIQGTGLGLAVSRALINTMGGDIIARNNPGPGTTFTFDLLATEAPVETQKVASHEPAQSRAGALARRTVLYIEDNPANLRLVQRLLGRLDHIELLTAERAGAGIELARTGIPDLILLDLNLPDMNGAAALKQLKADSATRDIPVAIVSADATPLQKHELALAGATAYLTKPFDLDELVNLVNGQHPVSDAS